MTATEIAVWVVTRLPSAFRLLRTAHEDYQTGKDVYQDFREAKGILPAEASSRTARLDITPTHFAIPASAVIPELLVWLTVTNYEDDPIKIWIATIPFMHINGIAITNIVGAPLVTIPPRDKIQVELRRPLSASECQRLLAIDHREESRASLQFRMVYQHQHRDHEWVTNSPFTDVRGSVAGGDERHVSHAEARQAIWTLTRYCRQRQIELPDLGQ